MKKYLAILIVLLLVVLGLTLVSAQEDELDVELPPSVEFLLDSFGGNFENYEEFIHPDWTWGGNGILQFEGHEGFVNAMGFWNTVFPDLEYELLHAVGNDEVWAVGVYLTGTNTVDFPPMDIVATNNTLEFYGYGFVYLEDGMVKDCDWTWDWISWYEALGIPYGPDVEEATD